MFCDYIFLVDIKKFYSLIIFIVSRKILVYKWNHPSPATFLSYLLHHETGAQGRDLTHLASYFSDLLTLYGASDNNHRLDYSPAPSLIAAGALMAAGDVLGLTLESGHLGCVLTLLGDKVDQVGHYCKCYHNYFSKTVISTRLNTFSEVNRSPMRECHALHINNDQCQSHSDIS